MSKYISTAFMNTYLDMEPDLEAKRLSPENEQIMGMILSQTRRVEDKFLALCSKKDYLNSEQLIELKELKESVDEFNELKAERLTSEERQQIIERLSSKESSLPLLGLVWLESLKRVQERTMSR